MIKAVTNYLREIAAKGGRGGKRGTKESMSRKGFGSTPLSDDARARAAATRSANRARDEREAMRQAVMRAHAKKGRKA